MNSQALSNLDFSKNQLTDASRKILAHELYSMLQTQGCQGKDIINLSTELLDLVLEDMRDLPD